MWGQGVCGFTGLPIRVVTLCGPIHLCVRVSEERGDGEGPGSEGLSDIPTSGINLIIKT